MEKTYGSFLSSGASLGINITITSIEPSIASPVEYANGTGPPTSAPAPGPAPALGTLRSCKSLAPWPMSHSPSGSVCTMRCSFVHQPGVGRWQGRHCCGCRAGRKLQQLTPPPMGGSPSQYVSSDMIVDTYAGPSSTFLEVTQPSQLLGYVAVGLLQYGYQVLALPSLWARMLQ